MAIVVCNNIVRINCSVCGKDCQHKKCKWPIIVLQCHGFYGRPIKDTGGRCLIFWGESSLESSSRMQHRILTEQTLGDSTYRAPYFGARIRSWNQSGAELRYGDQSMADKWQLTLAT